MKSPLYLFLAAALTLPAAAGAATPAGHDHASATPLTVELNAGKKWAIDAPLRKGMAAIQAAVSRTLPAAHAGKATAANYDALGATVSAQVAYIVENCKLEPKADAQLHAVIANLMGGVEAVQGKEGDSERASGVVKLAQALNTYGSHFDHAGWKALKLPH
ncbi:hypothetical protein B2J86_00880 [Acidovorax sp. SRB_14]|uniref:hypothetical protein n=1 Tax=unclassified Acidovorax TaxID=2684926 RepID=UPI00145F9BC5|nr:MULTISPECIES: hypothetical protein [unclassified Acidovorax]NMM77021.1 hypothetical protein [Acidovorax sp. SRB_24]NMM79496.1 hypothetical protein [Acidovorax sp. SRB_14]NMM84748.1 hypothetical protein [Rhodococcus sp. SRB_17]